MPQKLWRQAAAVVLGNLAYFAALPHLPREFQHHMMAFDAGLVLDFGLCVLLYFILGLFPVDQRGIRSNTK